MRLFKKSKYEMEFGTGHNVKMVVNYKGYDIYEYLNIIDTCRYTFWCSSEDSDYYSSLSSLDDCKTLIDRITQRK